MTKPWGSSSPWQQEQLSEALLADGASGLHGQPLVQAVPVEVVGAGQAAQHRPRHQLLQADGAAAVLLGRHAARAHNAGGHALDLMILRACCMQTVSV